MANKVKELFCYTTSPIGKLSEAIVKAVASAEIEVDVSEVDTFKTFCWCCALWRGVLVGGVVGLVVGYVLG